MIDICLTTYNSALFLRETLQSIFAQETQFSYRIIAVDDCSTDSSVEILEQFAIQYPSKIQIFKNSENLGLVANNWKAFKLCTAKYIAVIDSDDYWTDTFKLEKQVAFLELNSDYVMCYTNGLRKDDESGSEFTFSRPLKNCSFDLGGLLINANIWNSSVVYRNLGDAVVMPPWASKQKYNQDYTRHVLHVRYGRIHFIDECMGVYRVHGQNHSSIDLERLERIYLNNIYIANHLKQEISRNYHPLLSLQQARHWACLARLKRNLIKNLPEILMALFFWTKSGLSTKDLRDVLYLAYKG